MYKSDRHRTCNEDRQRVRDEDYSRHENKSRWSKDFSEKANYEASKLKEEEIRSEKSSSIAPLNIKAAQTEIFPSTVAVYISHIFGLPCKNITIYLEKI